MGAIASSSDLPPFTYDELPDPNSIRLIERLGTTSDGTLSFSLSCHSLDDSSTTYHCLSYTWGNPFAHGNQFREHFNAVSSQYEPSNKIPILVNGRLLLIQKSLHDALGTIPEAVFANEINRPDPIQGRTYLHFASGNGRRDYVEMWIKHGADVHARDRNARTALHYAAEKGHLDCVRTLCNGGSLRATKDQDGMTPMGLAKVGGHDDIVALLDSLSGTEDPQPSAIPRTQDWAHKRIWADAICINQDDVEEKSAQVNIMDRIYSRASFVVAWLGPDDGHSESGLKTLHTLATYSKQFQGSQIEPYGGSKEKYEEAGIPFVSREQWVALASIFQRQWFRRAWIVQEAILPGVLILQLGNNVLSWASLGTVSDAIRHNEARLGSAKSRDFVPENEVAVAVEWNMAEMYKWRENMDKTKGSNEEITKAYRNLFALDQLVECFWTFRASDPRDKIFSLYGIINLVSGNQSKADYRRSVASVYTSAARRMITETKNLEILSNCIYSKDRRDSLPGWVPDFDLAGINPIPSIFAADKGLDFQLPTEDTDESPVLKVRGFYVGKVSHTGGRQDTGPFGMFLFDENWLKLVLSLKKTKANGQKRCLTEILWRTLCMNMSPGSLFDASRFGSQAPDEYGNQFGTFIMLFILAGADRKVLEKADVKPGRDELIISRVSYDPFEEEMASVLADLDALAENDGERCYTPFRQEVLSFWNNLKYTLIRATGAGDDGGPSDFYLPEEVISGKSRCVGPGFVKPNSRVYRHCLGIGRAFAMMYGGRQLITVGDEYLGMAPLSTQSGDEIWILPGLKSPAVLRGGSDGDEKPVADTIGTLSLKASRIRRQFVGSAYIHGIMNGEAVSGIGTNLVDIDLV